MIIFTVPRRVEGWVDLGTSAKVHSPCIRLYFAAAVARNTAARSVIWTWVLLHHSQTCYILSVIVEDLAPNRDFLYCVSSHSCIVYSAAVSLAFTSIIANENSLEATMLSFVCVMLTVLCHYQLHTVPLSFLLDRNALCRDFGILSSVFISVFS